MAQAYSLAGAPYQPHTRVKPKVMAAAAAQVLEQSLRLPATFRREGFEAYKGKEGDAVNVRVEGILPFHQYGFRNDRSTPIETDVYTETTISVTLADHLYNAVALTDEQREWDLLDWSFLLGKQARAIARGAQRRAQEVVETASYNVIIAGCGDSDAAMIPSLAEANRVLNRFQVPEGPRYLVVGSDFEMAMGLNPDIRYAQNSGDAIASAALRQNSLGMIKGFQVIVDNTIDPESAYAYVDGGFVWANAAPQVPNSIAYGATANFESVALRVMQDYVADYMYDRQVVDTWNGFREVSDVLVGWDAVNEKEYISATPLFVRGVKLMLGGTANTATNYPAVGSELDLITGVNNTKGFFAGNRDDLTLA